MTIALGVLASDGLVIAADTEESDGFIKTNQRKIAIASNIHFYTYAAPRKRRTPPKSMEETATCAIAGAGNAGYLDTITPDLVDDFNVAHEGDENVLLSEFGKTVRQFYLTHVIPFALYPALDRPEFSVLIGLTRKGQSQNLLFASEKTALRRCAPYAAIGIGASFATMLLKRLWPDAWIDLKTAALLVSFIMFHVKESVANCGKFTDILVLHDGTRTYMPWQIGRELEALYLRYAKLEREAMHAVFGESEPHQVQAVNNVAMLFTELRKEIAKVSKPWRLESKPTRAGRS
jgi:hypothetical protein